MNRFFYGDIVVEVPDGVYFPREDSLLLAGIIEQQAPCSVLELGCGSGFLSILMARKGFRVLAVDLNPKAVEATRKNAANNFADFEAELSDLFENVRGAFDLIVFNPPYLPGSEPVDMQWSGGIELVRRFLGDAKKHLADNGKILFLISTLTGEAETVEAIKANGYAFREVKREKVPWEELIVYELRKN